MLLIDPTAPRFTRAELVADARARFGGFSEGTFRRWQECGLVAAPRHNRRWRKGQAGSAEGLWSDHDRSMLAALVEQRAKHASSGVKQLSLADLATLVIWVWIGWDDIVASDQVERALKTWTQRQVAGPYGKARSQSRLGQQVGDAVHAMAAPGASRSAERAVVDRLTTCLWSGDLPGIDGLAADLEALVDPHGAGRRLGAPGAGVNAREYLLHLRSTHRAATALIKADPGLTSDDWLATRNLLRRSWNEYAAEWPHLRAIAWTPAIFDRPTVEEQIGTSPRLLLAGLGARLDSRSDR